MAWLVTAKRESGSLSISSTGANNLMLTGNVLALFSPWVFVPILTYGFGADNYYYESMRSIRRSDDSGVAAEANIELELIPGGFNLSEAEEREEQSRLQHASKISKTITVALTLVLLILWPIPLYISGYVFSKPFFTGWVVAGFIWLFFSLGCVGIFPLWESRNSLMRTLKAIMLDLNAARTPTHLGRNPGRSNHPESLDLSIDS